ncbi:unnamed protein product [Rotaria socialis]|uniref:Nuclear receptor domain-containing protein n=3 Tax=Rotaria socialis TaxID=392032 RepID=A0A817UEN9_9BILA|nr:unnamed protein product [Rotaria socialis]
MQFTQAYNKCQVCGDCAFIMNYGVICCFPCRTFFRRNSLRAKKFPGCVYGGHCEINTITRKFCPPCRLMKCFTMGMSTDLIRKEVLPGKKRKLKAFKNQEPIMVTIPKPSALDRPSDGNYLTLNDSERVVISNVVHAYDAFSPIFLMRRTMSLLKTSASDPQHGISQAIRIMLGVYHGVQSFIGSTPDFKILTCAEQHSLLNRNLLGLVCGGLLCIVHESGMFDAPKNELVFSLLYGTELTQHARSICQKLNCDLILIKLLIIALAFSSNCYMVDNQENIGEDALLLGTFRLFGSQNAYVEILWKYLIHNYGFDRSVHIFSKLIKQFLDAFSLSMDMYANKTYHRIFLDEIVKEVETCSISDEQRVAPLWGKQP